MAFEGVSIDIMHNVLVVTSGLTQELEKKAWFDKDAKNLVINAAISAMNGI